MNIPMLARALSFALAGALAACGGGDGGGGGSQGGSGSGGSGGAGGGGSGGISNQAGAGAGGTSRGGTGGSNQAGSGGASSGAGGTSSGAGDGGLPPRGQYDPPEDRAVVKFCNFVVDQDNNPLRITLSFGPAPGVNLVASSGECVPAVGAACATIPVGMIQVRSQVEDGPIEEDMLTVPAGRQLLFVTDVTPMGQLVFTGGVLRGDVSCSAIDPSAPPPDGGAPPDSGGGGSPVRPML